MRKVFILGMLVFSPMSQASAFGEENISLAKMVTQLEGIYLKAKTMVDEAKAQSETLTTVSNTIKTIKNEVDTVKNSFLWNIDEVIKNDIESVTNLDDMGGMTLEDKLMTLSDELDRRLQDPNLSEADARILRDTRSLILREQMLRELEKASMQNLRNANDGVTDKEAAQITAQSAAIQAAIAAAEAKSHATDERRAVEDTAQMNRLTKQSAEIFEAAAKPAGDQ